MDQCIKKQAIWQNQIANISNVMAQRPVYSKAAPLSGAANHSVLPVHEKLIFVLQIFVKRTEKIIFSLVFSCFCFTEISYFLNFPSNENGRKQHLSASANFCVNMKFSYTIAGRKDEIVYCNVNK